MRHARLLLLLPAVFALGCPGDWDEPLGPVRDGHIDAGLVGEWRCAPEDAPDEDPVKLEIVPFDSNQYVLTALSLARRAHQVPHYRAHTTTVGGRDVMSVKELEGDPGNGHWTYMRFHQPQPGRLRIDMLKTEALEGVPADVDSRRQAIGDLFEDPALWESGIVCVPF